MQCKVIKRDGSKVRFESEKISKVVSKILGDTEPSIIAVVIEKIIQNITIDELDNITTQEINDYVEKTLMEVGYYEAAKSFILYRENNKRISNMSADNNEMSDYIFTSRYSKYVPRRKRRETWNECVDRVMNMHLKKYPEASKDIAWAFQQVREKRVLPSMRSMQFGGKPIESHNERMYNCTYSVVDRPEFFGQTMELLLSGCGVGFDVSFECINKLPVLKKPSLLEITHYTIDDTIEGWADAINVLVDSYINGYTAEFIYKKIRKSGEPIKSGGKAPGHVPLRRAIEKVRAIFDGAVDRKLKPIEAYDTVMHIADAVLSGGVRRSATICLFSKDDSEMMNAKVGNWIEDNPQRGRSNNSVKLIREATTEEEFSRIFEKQKAFGEPGFYFVNDNKFGTNPCVEIGLNPYLPVGYELKDGPTTEELTGFQFCNLTSINGARLLNIEDFKIAVRAATIIGTCQSGYTSFKYHGEVTEELCKREALLGVSITGVLDSPEVTLVPENLQAMAKYAIEVNEDMAKKIGVRPSARITCIKPEGSTSCLLNTASGIHPRHSKKYFRRVQANINDPVYKHFKENNPHCCEPSVWSANKTDDVITFCITAPEDAITKDDITAIEFLEIVKLVQQNWVIPGTARPDSTEGLYHNVSNTVSVKDHEWDDVFSFIYDNREYFTGISLLADNGNIYQQAPHEQLNTHDDELHWSSLMHSYRTVDYTLLNEDDDNTIHKDIVACGSGGCEIR